MLDLTAVHQTEAGISQTVVKVTVQQSKKVFPLLIIFGIACLGGVSGALMYQHLSNSQRSQTTGHIIVLRAGDYIKNISSDGVLSPAAADKVTQQIRADANHLAQRGFIVLDESAILGAPPNLIFDPASQ